MNTPELREDHDPTFQATIRAVQAASKRGEKTIAVSCMDAFQEKALRALGKAYEIEVQFKDHG